MAGIALEHVEKKYDNGFHAVHDLNLDISDGEFLVLVGPSGCGKSTALRMIAGLETITAGTLAIDGRVVNNVEPKDRDIAMVFQSYALYPHMTVRDNIAFPLKLQKLPKSEIAKRVDEAARSLELTEYLDRRPGQLSGGQRQRVAMGRAIVRKPKAFLMDEPLSNLDAKLRVQMRAEIARLQRNLGVTTVYVTHDQVEAMTMGDRVAVLNRGELQQVDSPQNLYDHPDNLFVASFIGSPQMNLMRGRLSIIDGGASVSVGSQQLQVPASVMSARPALAKYDGQEVAVGIRPADMEDASLARNAAATLTGKVEVREGLGSEVLLHLSVDAPRVAGAEDTGEVEKLFIARVDPRTSANVDDVVTLAVDVDHIHFFDLETGLAIRS